MYYRCITLISRIRHIYHLKIIIDAQITNELYVVSTIIMHGSYKNEALCDGSWNTKQHKWNICFLSYKKLDLMKDYQVFP